MSISLYNFNFFILKIFKNKFTLITSKNLSFLNKNILFFYKRLYLLFFIKSVNNFKNLISFLFFYLKGFCICFTLEGKRFKFLINNKCLFFKMDTSHFKSFIFNKNFFLKKTSKNKKLYFFTYNSQFIKYSLLTIQKLKKPTKYKKKGFFLNNII